MIVYWLMYLAPLLALAARKADRRTQDRVWLALCVFFVFIIGLRFEVGGDWDQYLDHFDFVSGESLIDTLSLYDWGYALFEWLSHALDWGIYGVNTACAALVITGVYQFCRKQPEPWLALTVAVPYLIIVVAMGYTRQGVALGLELIALVALANGQLVKYAFLILLAATFHKTAVILLPLAALSVSYSSVWKQRILVGSTIAGVVGMVGLTAFSEGSELLFTNYVTAQMISEGAPIRVAMNALPAAIFLLFRKHLARDEVERRIWTLLAILSLACIPFVPYASTATDRVALYFIPMQLFVYSRLGPLFFSRDLRTLTNFAIFTGYAVVLFVLLNYAPIVTLTWLPYQNAAILW